MRARSPCKSTSRQGAHSIRKPIRSYELIWLKEAHSVRKTIQPSGLFTLGLPAHANSVSETILVCAEYSSDKSLSRHHAADVHLCGSSPTPQSSLARFLMGADMRRRIDTTDVPHRFLSYQAHGAINAKKRRARSEHKNSPPSSSETRGVEMDKSTLLPPDQKERTLNQPPSSPRASSSSPFDPPSSSSSPPPSPAPSSSSP